MGRDHQAHGQHKQHLDQGTAQTAGKAQQFQGSTAQPCGEYTASGWGPGLAWGQPLAGGWCSLQQALAINEMGCLVETLLNQPEQHRKGRR